MTLPERRPERIRIERIWPQIDGGRYPVKRALGDRVQVWATLIRDGHEVLGGAVRYRPAGTRRWRDVPMRPIPRPWISFSNSVRYFAPLRGGVSRPSRIGSGA